MQQVKSGKKDWIPRGTSAFPFPQDRQKESAQPLECLAVKKGSWLSIPRGRRCKLYLSLLQPQHFFWNTINWRSAELIFLLSLKLAPHYAPTGVFYNNFVQFIRFIFPYLVHFIGLGQWTPTHQFHYLAFVIKRLELWNKLIRRESLTVIRPWLVKLSL